MIKVQRVTLELWCDKVMMFALCTLLFFLPISIAIVDSFAGLAILSYVIKKISQGKGFYPHANFLNRPIEIFVIVVLISVFQSHFFTTSLTAFFGKFAKGILLYFCFVEACVTEKRVRLVLGVFLASALLTGISGIWQLYTGEDFLRNRLYVGLRISSSFGQPNTFGAYLLLPLAIVSHLLFASAGKNRPLWQLGLAVLLAVLLIGLCWTFSRSSWIGYLVVLGIMVLMDKRKFFFGLALFLMVIYIFLPNLSSIRQVSLFKDNVAVKSQTAVPKSFVGSLKEGGSGRFDFWNNAIFMIKKSPVWGLGLNTYNKNLKKYSLPRWYAHNCYLQMAAEIGLVGLGCFLWLLFVLFSKSFICLKRISNDAWSKPLLQGLLAGLGGLLVNSFFDNTLYTVQLGVLFWAMIGFTAAVIYFNCQGTFDKTPLSK
jgi:putative inorganic carbon (hco3(-)) transporter